MIKQYVKRPIPVQSVQWESGQESLNELCELTGGTCSVSGYNGSVDITFGPAESPVLLNVRLGDWVMKGVEDEIYSCPASVFAKSYDLYEPPAPEGDE